MLLKTSPKHTMIKLVEWKDAIKNNYFFIECVFNKEGLYANPDGEPEYPYQVEDIPELWEVVEAKRREMDGERWGFMDYILSNETNPALYFKKFSEQLICLADKFEAQNFIFAMDIPCKWMTGEAEHDEIRAAYSYLKSIGVTESFDGGYIVPKSELPQILPHLFWMVRCTSEAPVRFVMDDIPIVFMLCKYFNLHTIFYNEKLYCEQIDNLISTTGLILCKTERCVRASF